MPDRILRGALGIALLFVVSACSEQVTSSLGCPELCTDQSAQLRDTVLADAVVFDTTLTGYPLLGTTRELSLVARGDTADVRVVARFDTLPNRFVPAKPQSDSLIAFVDSATMIFVIDTAFVRPTSPVTIDAFDVDTTAADTNRAALVPLFRDDRLIGSRTFQPAELRDTLRLPLNNSAVLAKIQANARLRVGLKIRQGSYPTLRVTGTAFAPRVRFRVSADSTVAPDTVQLTSLTPSDPLVASGLTLYPVIAAGALPSPPQSLLAVGGINGARSYLRFLIPSIVLDSVQVIRASLELTQVPSRSPGGSGDTLTVLTTAILAGVQVTDVPTELNFLAPVGAFPVDTLRLLPGRSGTRTLEIVNLVRAWKVVGADKATRAIVITVPQEGSSPGELDFYSSDAPADVRPRLRLTYVPRRGFGIP
ncbi:MAG TPA: hypothetical protein VFP15_04685 [Gemmatimonadaceae bacterium]|nr:hypothetical protein [Gemmatimonadaceae bacterium]